MGCYALAHHNLNYTNMLNKTSILTKFIYFNLIATNYHGNTHTCIYVVQYPKHGIEQVMIIFYPKIEIRSKYMLDNWNMGIAHITVWYVQNGFSLVSKAPSWPLAFFNNNMYLLVASMPCSTYLKNWCPWFSINKPSVNQSRTSKRKKNQTMLTNLLV